MKERRKSADSPNFFRWSMAMGGKYLEGRRDAVLRCVLLYVFSMML
jgi:hypothetical protein